MLDRLKEAHARIESKCGGCQKRKAALKAAASKVRGAARRAVRKHVPPPPGARVSIGGQGDDE